MAWAIFMEVKCDIILVGGGLETKFCTGPQFEQLQPW